MLHHDGLNGAERWKQTFSQGQAAAVDHKLPAFGGNGTQQAYRPTQPGSWLTRPIPGIQQQR